MMPDNQQAESARSGKKQQSMDNQQHPGKHCSRKRPRRRGHAATTRNSGLDLQHTLRSCFSTRAATMSASERFSEPYALP